MAREDSAEFHMSERRERFLTSTWGALLAAAFCCLLWGSAFPCIKIGYGLFGIAGADTASQMLFAGTRFLLAGVMVILFVSATSKMALVPQLALFQTFGQYAFFYLGLAHAAGTTSSVIEASANFFAILLSALAFRQERLTSRKVVGCLLGFAGVVLINLGGSLGSLSFSFSPDGEGMILLSTLCSATSSCLIQQLSARHDPVLLSGWQFVLGGLGLMAMGVAGGGVLSPTGPSAIALLAYMAFISAAAYSVWSLLLSVNSVSRISVYGFMNPVFGFVLSAVLLGEYQQVDPVRSICALRSARKSEVLYKSGWEQGPAHDPRFPLDMLVKIGNRDNSDISLSTAHPRLPDKLRDGKITHISQFLHVV